MGKLRIGNEIIYPQQVRMADRIMKRLLTNEKPGTERKLTPILVLEVQGGKTGAMIYTIKAFVDDCRKRRRTFQVVVLTGLSDLSLTRQTKGRLLISNSGPAATRRGAELDVLIRDTKLAVYEDAQYLRDGMVVENCSTRLKRLALNRMPIGAKQEPEVRLWVIDEAHLGNGVDGNIDTVFRNHGIMINKQLHTWDQNTINHVLIVSATPSAHILKTADFSSVDDSLFELFYEAPPSTYNGMKDMLRNGRLRDSTANIVQSQLLKQEILPEFEDECRAKGPGYLVIRAQGKKYKQILAAIKAARYRYEAFDCSIGNINDLNNKLGTKPDHKEVILIRGAMRAGITLEYDNFIRGWVETAAPGANPDSQVQSGVGRACGYGRKDDTYKIWCSLSNVTQWVNMYEALARRCADGITLNTVPKGIQNHAHNDNQRLWYDVKKTYTDYDEAWKKYVYPWTTKAVKNGDAAPGIDLSKDYRRQISRSSENVYLDSTGMLLEGRRDSGSTSGVYLDGPTTDDAAKRFIKNRLGRGAHVHTTADEVWGWVKRNRASWKRMENARPELKGKVCIFDLDNPKKISNGSQRKGDLSLRSKAAVKSR